jgi:hypothetical protein
VSEQLALFDKVRAEPEGLRYAADFVSPAIERELVRCIRTLPLQPFQFGQFEGKRRVASFGFRYDYAAPIEESRADSRLAGGNRCKRGDLRRSWNPNPAGSLHRIRRRCRHRLAPRQAPFREDIGLSLGAACKFRFRRPVGKSWERFTLDAEPRSLYMMSGPSRLTWEHSIPAVEAPRYSITFRTMTDEPDLGASA